jgi:hypothetical protein
VSGEYVIEASMLGYRSTRSPRFRLQVEDTVRIEVMLTPEPLGIEGLKVTVEREAEEYLRSFGLTPARLGRRWIPRERIEEMTMPGGAKDILRWQSLPGVWVRENDRAQSKIEQPAREFCVLIGRRSVDRCALIILNGVSIDYRHAADLLGDSHEIEAFAVFTPEEATLFYGTIGGGGAVVIWTRAGGRRRK